MGVYINTWNSITKAQVEADENLNVIYEVDDNTKIRAIELKDNKDSYAVWFGDDRCNLFRLNQSVWVPLFNYLFHKYGVWYCLEDYVEDCLYEEDAYIRSAMYHKAYVEFVDEHIDSYTEEEKKERDKMMDWADGIFMMRSAQIFLEEMFNFDEIVDEALTNNSIKDYEYDDLLRTIPYLKEEEGNPLLCKALKNKLIEGIELIKEKIEKGEMVIIKKEVEPTPTKITNSKPNNVEDPDLPF